MAGGQRKCARCRFFKDAGIAGNGWCTHPKRQLTTDAMLLVRAGELACRNDWGGDLFQSRDEASETDDPASGLPGQSDLPAARDDEVTSVITRPERPSHTTPEDRVVSDRPVPSHRDDDDDPWNDAAHREQEERARVIARGSRDALLHARQRHSSRHARNQPDPDAAESTADHDPVVTPQPRFTSRSHSRFSAPSYSTAPVPRAEIETRQSTAQERFDSVPPIDPNFDLPGLIDEPLADPPEEQSTAPHGNDESRPRSSYEYAVNRARRTRQQRQHKHHPVRRARSSRVVPDEAQVDVPGPSMSEDQVTMVPETTLAPVQTAAPLPDLDLEGDVETVEEPPVGRVAAAAAPDEPPHEDEAKDIHTDAPEVHEHPQDSYDLHEDDALDTEDEDRHENHVPTLQPGRAHGRWFSRFIPSRQHPGDWHDEGGITRHTVADAGQEPETAVPAHGDISIGDEAPAAQAPRDRATVLARAWPEPRRGMTRISGSAVENEDDVADDNTSSRIVYIDNSDAAPNPEPVQDTRHRQEPLHRQRMARELPDLDDNLFGEHIDRTRQEQRAVHAVDRAPARTMQIPPPSTDRLESGIPSSASPRESYFRAAKYRDWPGARTQVAVEDPGEHEAQLPDLEEHDFDLRELVARGGELMDMTIDIAPEIPRECRTCRSFRSADGGARGWCTNEWAFTHRRMVNEDDLACDSTIGCWWLPADRYWLTEEQDDFAATPRMDKLIARRYPQEPDREGISG